MPSITNNASAATAQANIGRANANAAASIARLSSGNRIIKASDDVSGLATGTALRTQVTTLKQALANAAQGTSLLQVADGGLGQIIDILQRQKAIAVQASSGQLTDTNRSLLNQEFTALTAEVDRIATSTNFNGVSLLGGGLGLSSALSRTDATAATATLAAPTSGTTGVVSTVAIQAFTNATGVAVSANVATIGGLTVTDSGGNALANAQYLGVDASLYGQFSNFSFSNITYGAGAAGSATMSATINGVTYTGAATGAGTTATLGNGNTYIKIGTGTLDFTNQSSTDNTRAAIANAFKTVYIARTGTVSGVDFQGTTLTGAIGTTAAGLVTTRLTNNGSLNINNFQYVNGAAANTNLLTVEVNGQTFTAAAVQDVIAAATTIQFTSGDKLQSILINTTGLTNSTGNIRTSLTDRAAFVSALNTGFSRAGGNGLNFSIGSAATDKINVALSSAKTSSIFAGNTLSVSTASAATTASSVLDNAINSVVSLRSTVGALQSRFNFASNAVQSALENQDSARSLFLDVDVSTESSAYSSAQVQLQAGISVLAQANQLPQNLLKLIQ